MSYYYNYYVGYKKDGKIYPLGPYNCRGQLRSVMTNSRSFASNLYNEFYSVPDNMISDELRQKFENEDWNGNKTTKVKYLPVNELPRGSYIKSGYFLISDVQEYEKTGDTSELFYDTVSPTIYAAKLDYELKFGKTNRRKISKDLSTLNHRHRIICSTRIQIGIRSNTKRII